MLPMNRKPTHPGEILRYEYLEPMGMSEAHLSESLRIPLSNINGLVKGEDSVTSDIAFRLAKFFNTSVEFWLNLQRNLDMWETLRIHGLEYEKITPFSASYSE